MTARPDYGDGDRCPTVPEHGRMYVIGQMQYCAHVAHAGRPRSHPSKEAAPTRCSWPLYGLGEASHDLPDIDITALES